MGLQDYRIRGDGRLSGMLRTAFPSRPLLNGILALGFLLVLASLAGLMATAVFRSCMEERADRNADGTGALIIHARE
jgi:hypothetical protein